MAVWLSNALLAATLVLPSTGGRAATIHVDAANAGDPSMDGSPAHPWDTIQKGVDALTNQTPAYGHTVLVAAGTYGNVVLTASHRGTNDNVNTLLTTAGARIRANSSTHGIAIGDGLNHFTVEGFHISEANGGIYMADPSGVQTGVTVRACNLYSNVHGVWMATTANARIERCNLVFNTGHGLWAQRENRTPIHSCVIAGNCGYGINEGIISTTLQISNCVFYANRGHWYDWIGPGYSGEINWSQRVTAAQINAAPGCGGNIEANPGFTGLAAWNFNELMANSPCLNAGVGGADIGAHQDPPVLSLDHATYWVDAATGGDGNDGSSGSPWVSVTNAAAHAKAGDTVVVKAGVYTGGVLIVRGGSADEVVTYRAETNVTLVVSNSASGIEFRRAMGAVVDGFQIDGASKAANAQCVYLNQCASNTVRNSTLRRAGTYGIYARNSLLCAFEGCSVYSNSYGAYTYVAPEIAFRNCDLRNNSNHGYWGAHQQVSFVVMENCLVRNNTARGLHVGQFAGGRLLNCTVVSNGTDGIGQNGAYSSWSVTNCIFAGNGGYGVREVFSTQMGTIQIGHCDLYANGTGNFYDIYTNNATGVALNTAGEINHNAIPAGNTNNIVADPRFTDRGAGDFSLKKGSPCLDAGAAVGMTNDYAGSPRLAGMAVDIGAFERPYSPAGPLVTVR